MVSFSVTILFARVHEKICPNFVTKIFNEKLARQFLCGKEKMSYVKVCSCAQPVTESLPHTQGLPVASLVLCLPSLVTSGA